ncbi:C-type lectin domain family 17, member A [Budorcas taxicolor]|uniref:C-type lectin domain family 17, member A n=1 Tax=Budorcas taxicolor TaxID=37181 RepID=UPI0022833CA6|nr:C-type lectin domain family 17, member A [Budorcas taxicolor]
MCALYTNAGYRDLPEGSREEDDDDDYENMTPPYKDLPPKPGWMAPPRPPRAGKKTERPPLPCKLPKNTGLNVTPVTSLTPQLGTDLTHPASQPPEATTPVPWISQKFGGLRRDQERLMVCLLLLVVVSLLMGCTGLVVTLIKYQEVVEDLRMLTFQQMAWRANVTGMMGLAGLKKDIEHIRADTNQSLLELRGLLDCTRVTCPEGWLPFQGKCYYFSPSTKSWDEARKFCQENYSHLVIISNSDEQDFVAKAHGSPRVYWLGLNDRDVEGDWRWLDGSPVTLSFWDPQEPNNLYNNENCASMNKGGTWNDLSCDKTTYWICERKCSC